MFSLATGITLGDTRELPSDKTELGKPGRSWRRAASLNR